MSEGPSSEYQAVYSRRLARLAASIFGTWGSIVFFKSLYDLFKGEPEANLYSARPWQFVSLNQWTRYAAFELCYALCCLALAWAIFRYARFLPETIRRKRKKPRLSLWS